MILQNDDEKYLFLSIDTYFLLTSVRYLHLSNLKYSFLTIPHQHILDQICIKKVGKTT